MFINLFFLKLCQARGDSSSNESLGVLSSLGVFPWRLPKDSVEELIVFHSYKPSEPSDPTNHRVIPTDEDAVVVFLAEVGRIP